jgi:cyclopropane-fatty-acyl-phospholipid synthase
MSSAQHLVDPTGLAGPPRPASRIDRWCLARLAAAFAGAPVVVELWDGTRMQLGPEPLAGTVHVEDRGTLVRLLLQPDLAFGEAYTAGRLKVERDLAGLITAINRAMAGRWPVRPKRHDGAASPDSARSNVHVHYDIGNDFYQLWLDPEMVYTCAYFEHPDVTLEEAQTAKLELVCRKLRLRPTDRVIEAGCGWGALAIYMARRYGVSVRAFNISEAQLAFARERARREGVADRVEFVNADYRAIEGTCDAFVSIGMLEHVGLGQYAELGEVIDRVLDARHGRGLLHFIGKHTPQPFNAWTTKYIFPGAYAPTLGEVSNRVFEQRSLAITDVENLRPHYALTLRHWLQRFEAHAEAIRGRFDERFVRTWRLYLATALAGFDSGDLQLYQIAFGRLAGEMPWTRRGLYERPPA